MFIHTFILTFTNSFWSSMIDMAEINWTWDITLSVCLTMWLEKLKLQSDTSSVNQIDLLSEIIVVVCVRCIRLVIKQYNNIIQVNKYI